MGWETEILTGKAYWAPDPPQEEVDKKAAAEKEEHRRLKALHEKRNWLALSRLADLQRQLCIAEIASIHRRKEDADQAHEESCRPLRDELEQVNQKLYDEFFALKRPGTDSELAQRWIELKTQLHEKNDELSRAISDLDLQVTLFEIERFDAAKRVQSNVDESDLLNLGPPALVEAWERRGQDVNFLDRRLENARKFLDERPDDPDLQDEFKRAEEALAEARKKMFEARDAILQGV